MLPNATGGANWQGGSFDPETKIFYIFTNTTSRRSASCSLTRTIGLRWVQGTARDPMRRRPDRDDAAPSAGAAAQARRSGARR